VAIPFERLGWLFVRYGKRVYPDWADPLLFDWLQTLPRGALLLDLGGGTGVLAAEARRERPDLRLVVVDPAVGMLKHAGEGVDTVVARAEELPFADAGVDAVMLGEALHHFQDPKQALAEAARVLKPGGRLWIYDFDPRRGLGRWVFWGERLLGEPANFYAPLELQDVLSSLGFSVAFHERGGRYVLQATLLLG